MGEVYLARDPRLGRLTVLKLLPADFAKDEQRVRRFAQEPARPRRSTIRTSAPFTRSAKRLTGATSSRWSTSPGITLRERMAQRRLSCR